MFSYLIVNLFFILERFWRFLKYDVLKGFNNRRIDELILTLLSTLSTRLQEERKAMCFKPVAPKLLKLITDRIRRGNRLLANESNYQVILNVPADAEGIGEIHVYFRNSECRVNHDAACKEVMCSYNVRVAHRLATCTCPSEPILCKHIHAAIILSGFKTEQWGLRLDSLKNEFEENEKETDNIRAESTVHTLDADSDISEISDEITAEIRTAREEAARILAETGSIRLNALEKLKKAVSASQFDAFMHEYRTIFEAENFFNSLRTSRARKTRPMRAKEPVRTKIAEAKTHHGERKTGHDGRSGSSKIKKSPCSTSDSGSDEDGSSSSKSKIEKSPASHSDSSSDDVKPELRSRSTSSHSDSSSVQY